MLKTKKFRLLPAKGTEFEHYIGELLKLDGWQVDYNELFKGENNGGLDLICKKGDITALIQCKYITDTENQIIHESDINQLQEATEFYKKKSPKEKVSTTIITTSKLSEDAIKAAETHRIEVVDKQIIDFKLKL